MQYKTEKSGNNEYKEKFQGKLKLIIIVRK